MNAPLAYRHVGESSAREPFLSSMILALSMHSWHNTPEETARLEAAKWIKRNRKAYYAHCRVVRDARK